MGLGYALSEAVLLQHGIVQNRDFSTYLLPTALDVPEVQVDLVQSHPNALGPHGAKGVAEPALISTAAAIANGVKDATGVRPFQLPITSEMLWRLLRASNSVL